MGIPLPTPREPEELKEYLKKQRDNMDVEDDVERDSLAVWYMNRFPSYLWSCWREPLTSWGYTWQRFVRVLRYATNDIVSWAIYDEIGWDELISRIVKLLKRYARRGGVNA